MSGASCELPTNPTRRNNDSSSTIQLLCTPSQPPAFFHQQKPPRAAYISVLMRVPSVVRTLYVFTNTTLRATTPAFNVSRLYSIPPRATVYRSMPLPFIGALFGTSNKMADSSNYPVQKTEGEWQAQLSPGLSPPFTAVYPQPLTRFFSYRAIPHPP